MNERLLNTVLKLKGVLGAVLLSGGLLSLLSMTDTSIASSLAGLLPGLSVIGPIVLAVSILGLPIYLNYSKCQGAKLAAAAAAAEREAVFGVSSVWNTLGALEKTVAVAAAAAAEAAPAPAAAAEAAPAAAAEAEGLAVDMQVRELPPPPPPPPPPLFCLE
jgi:hypothetical protein